MKVPWYTNDVSPLHRKDKLHINMHNVENMSCVHTPYATYGCANCNIAAGPPANIAHASLQPNMCAYASEELSKGVIC
jgi:hypothetical protein